MNMQEWLAEQKEKFREGAEQSKKAPEYKSLPDGKYSAKMVSIEFGVSKSSQRPQLVWKWMITAGTHTGEFQYNFQGLDKENSWMYVHKDLARFGYDPDALPDPSELESTVFHDLMQASPLARISLKTKNGYQSTYIDKVAQNGEDFSDEEASDEINREQNFTSDGYNPFDDGSDASVDSSDPSSDQQDGTDTDSPEDIELAIGMTVRFTRSGEIKEGTVRAIEEDEAKVQVGGRTYTVPLNELEVLLGETTAATA